MTLGEVPADDGPGLAGLLRARREERGISQSQAARELEVARTAYRLWELEAARPAPDRWRLVARWLGVSMTTLLLAEGLISGEEGRETGAAEARFIAATGESAEAATQQVPGDFFMQAHAYIDRGIESGAISAEEAGQFRGMFERIRAGVGGEG
jgi:transcriptional regulator with XRE-family HTH domain